MVAETRTLLGEPVKMNESLDDLFVSYDLIRQMTLVNKVQNFVTKLIKSQNCALIQGNVL